MKLTNLLSYIIACTILLTSFTSCNDDGPVDLYLSVPNLAYLKMGEETAVFVFSGNGGYTAKVDNEFIVTAKVNDNLIELTPLNLGKTTLTVTDRENKTASIDVYVTEPYMAFYTYADSEITVRATTSDVARMIKDDVRENLPLLAEHIYNLKKTDDKTYSVYGNIWGSTPEFVGTYSFDIEHTSFTSDDKNGKYTHTLNLEEYGARMFFNYFTKDQAEPLHVGSRMSVEQEMSFVVSTDLTAKYQELYPDKGVESVAVASRLLPIEYRFE